MNGKHSDVLIESARSRTNKGCTDEGTKHISGRVSFAQNTFTRYFTHVECDNAISDQLQSLLFILIAVLTWSTNNSNVSVNVVVTSGASNTRFFTTCIIIPSPIADCVHCRRITLYQSGLAYFYLCICNEFTISPFVVLPHYITFAQPRDHIRVRKQVKDRKYYAAWYFPFCTHFLISICLCNQINIIQ